MAKKKDNPFIEKMEEKQGKDLDGDGEKGESAKHKAKVFGANKTEGKKKKGNATVPPLLKNSKMKPMDAKVSRPSAGTGDKVCPKCKGKGIISCKHM